MELTIHQIGDFIWFSERKTSGKYGSVISALRAHINYVESRAVAIFNSATNILAKAKEELKKRWDSRVALKFFIAVPYGWSEKEAVEIVVSFVSKQLKIPLENISAFYHADRKNPHIHLLIYPRDEKGKKLRIGRKELKEFHQAWDNLLRELGYEIKRYKNGVKFEKLKIEDEAFKLENLPNWLLEKDVELKELYQEYIKLRNELFNELRQLDDELSQAEEVSEEDIKKANRPIWSMFRFGDFKDKQLKEIEAQIKALHLKPEDKVAIVLVAENKKPLQRVLSVEKVLNERFLRFLRAKNREGYNVYITLNTLKKDAKRRTKADFLPYQRRIYLDIDGEKHNKDGLKILEQIISREKLPKPTLVVRTSKLNIQAVWVLSEERKAGQLEAVMKHIAEKYGLDYTQDISRVFRLAGFFNRKKGKDNFIYVDRNNSTFKTVDFEPFEKFLPNLLSLEEQKRKKGFNVVEQFEYSKELDKYLKAIETVFKNDSYKEEVIKRFKTLAKAIKEGEKRFKSSSEFELALAHLINKAIPYDDYKERKKILAKKFKEILELVRPWKLKRNKKYVEITINKVLGTSSDGASRRARVRNFSFEQAKKLALQIKREIMFEAGIMGYKPEAIDMILSSCKEFIVEEIREKRGYSLNSKALSVEQAIAMYLALVEKPEEEYGAVETVAQKLYKAALKKLAEAQKREEAKKRDSEKVKRSRNGWHPMNGGFSPGI